MVKVKFEIAVVSESFVSEPSVGEDGQYSQPRRGQKCNPENNPP